MQLSAEKDATLKLRVSEMHVRRRHFLTVCTCLGIPFSPVQYQKTQNQCNLPIFFSVLGPIIELQEMELVDLWGGFDQEVSEEVSEQLVLAQTGISEGEILALDPADENRQGTLRMGVREGLFEPRGMSEAETGGIPKEENQAAASSDTELRKEGEEVAPELQSPDFEGSGLDGDTIHKEKSSCHEDIKTERETESAGADRQEEAFPGPVSTGGEPVAEAVKETPAKKESSSRHHGSSETRLEDEDLLQMQGKGKARSFILADLNRVH